MSIYIALPFLVPIVSSEGGVTEKIDLLPLSNCLVPIVSSEGGVTEKIDLLPLFF